MTTEMQPVVSSQIEACGHDVDASLLTIRFKGGARYEYRNVDSEMFAALVTAKSVGAYFTKEIKAKPERYPYRKLT